MPSFSLSVVPLDLIPKPPYETPASDLPRLYAAAKEMERLCRSLKGMGLAASQVGLPWRMFVFWKNYPIGDSKFECVFNCSYEPRSGDKFPSVEGCLSLPGESYRVDRYSQVTVSGSRLVEGEEGVYQESFQEVYEGVMAVLMQHEIDHDHGRERMIDSIGAKVMIA